MEEYKKGHVKSESQRFQSKISVRKWRDLSGRLKSLQWKAGDPCLKTLAKTGVPPKKHQ